MTFSQFANLLYPFYGDGSLVADFVITLVDQIMQDPSTDLDDQKEADGEYNPLSALVRGTRTKIYNGTRDISEKSASSILKRLDKFKFEEFINTLSEDAMSKLCDVAKDHRVDATYQEIAAKCADIFEQILLAFANPANTVTLSVIKNSLFEVSREITPDLSVAIQYNLRLLIETKGFCPNNNCNKPLYITDNSRSIERYKVTKIEPNSSSAAVDNMIALCPECHDKYALSHTEEDVLRLSKIKAALVREASASELASTVDVESGIDRVLQKIATMQNNELIKLKYKPVRVTRKIRKENGLLLRKTLQNVTTYYPYLKEVFQQLSKAGKLRFETFAVQVRLCYLKECSETRSQP